MELFLNFINNIYPLPEEILKKLLSSVHVKSYKNGEHLSELGAVNNKLFFIIDGITRTYMKLQSSEINKSIKAPGQLAGSLKSAMDKEPAQIACQALSDIVVAEITVDHLAELRNEYPVFGEFMYKALEIEYTNLEKSLIDLLSKNATERYLILRETIKNIDQLIPQYQIASHLGITPIQLSRIRKKLLKQ
ncbi:MAG: Crp/Fnr family transcriptional regulator [Wenyingzhuangia sp.]|jgi:CRP-like cAMP-binding protein|uniref:Crp/Fnr family transcriptional regulator n=1 Tax=Wenyingzhuangia sp. TaxID=1964193 RepID=UPI0032190077